METMQAVRIHAYGGLEALTYEPAPCPEVNDGQVLIHIHAASVNPVDNAVRAGYMAGYLNPSFPLILGMDVAGTIEVVGSGVTGFVPGDAVFARTDLGINGAYAEYIVLDADEVVAMPRTIDFVHAAALPHASLTAWRGLVDAAYVEPGQKVLIHAAAGGVGHIAVQLAKARGAYVYGTASTRNQDFLRQIGVDQPIDYTTDPFEIVAHDVDVVFDSVGGETQERSWQTLKPGGILLSVIQAPSEQKAAEFSCRQQFIMAMPPVAPVLREIVALVDAGKIKPHVSEVLTLADAAKAQEMVLGGHTRGKIVLKTVE